MTKKFQIILAVIVSLSSSAVMAEISTVRIATAFSQPLFVTAAPGDADRLFVLEKTGNIKILDRPTGNILTQPFLNIDVSPTNSERGLLGMAFHPDYNKSGSAGEGKFYVSYTDPASRIVEYQVSAANPNVADPTSARSLLSISQPSANHNGGWIGFNPKVNETDPQHLYIAIGDGGGGNDGGSGHTSGIGNGQDITNNLLGKMLRIDVNGDDFANDANRNYSIPADNPFVGKTGDDEIWAYGLRNPWRNSFDRETGDLYIGDVGQGAREEIDYQPASSPGGENYGWRLREGTIATPASGIGGAKPTGAIDPIYDYTRGSGDLQGTTVTGGYVYRGPIQELQGHYFFADFGNHRIWSLRPDDTDPINYDGTNFVDFTDWTDTLDPDVGTIAAISSFGEDALGNLYIVDFSGEIYMVIPEPASVVLLGLGAIVVAASNRRTNKTYL